MRIILLLALFSVAAALRGAATVPPTAAETAQGDPSAAPQRQQKMVALGELRIDEKVIERSPDSDRVVALLRKELIAALVQSRKLAILDRDFTDQISKEKHPGDGDRSEAGRTVKLGKEATADLLITGSVVRFSHSVDRQVLKLSGKTVETHAYSLGCELQVIDVVSGRVLFADAFQEQERPHRQASESEFGDWSARSVRMIAERAVSAVLETVYPLKVALVTDGEEVVLNEGGTRVRQGDQFEVFATGRAMVDPDTGVELGCEEKRIARVEATRVLPKATYACVIESTGDKILPGAICRKSKDAPSSEAGKTASGVESAPSHPEKKTSEDTY